MNVGIPKEPLLVKSPFCASGEAEISRPGHNPYLRTLTSPSVRSNPLGRVSHTRNAVGSGGAFTMLAYLFQIAGVPCIYLCLRLRYSILVGEKVKDDKLGAYILPH